MKSAKAIFALAILALPLAANARVHTWIPNPTAQAAGGTQTVVIIGNRIQWGAGSFDDAVWDDRVFTYSSSASMIGPMRAIAGKFDQALDMADICYSPFAEQFRNTTARDIPEIRFQAANRAYNQILLAKLPGFLHRGQGNIEIMLEGTLYKGFRASYSDGSSELWLVNPAYAYSSMRLIGSPVLGTLQKPKNPRKGCTGSG